MVKEHLFIVAVVFLGALATIGLTLWLAGRDSRKWIRLQRRVKIRPRRR